jgi:tRNA G18 (ribose-2'-O)-methylase SpoU
MPRTLAAAVNSGWAVIGAAAEADAVPLSDFKIDGPTVLVMGE